MKQWEYKFVNLLDSGSIGASADEPLDQDRWYEDQLQRLNDLGAGGWEVVAVFLDKPYRKGDMLLKRKRPQRGKSE